MNNLPAIRRQTFRPKTVSRARAPLQNQDVMICRDASGSMAGRKARDASKASADLVGLLGGRENHDAFRAAIVDFSATATIRSPLQKAASVKAKPIKTTGSTNISAALEAAETMLGDGSAEAARPVVVLYSDGQHNVGSLQPTEVAGRLKSLVDVVTVAVGEDADEHTLREIASEGLFFRCSDTKALRRFFGQFGLTLSKSLQMGTNSTQALKALASQQQGQQQ